VIAREGFDAATLNSNYRKVALFSADAARSSYLTQMQVSNPQSPLVVYPRSTIIDAQVKSVSPLGANAALVRFDTVRQDKGAQPRPAGSWVAVIRYRYSSAAMKLEDRFVNPLGFQIINYRKDPEALPAVTANAASTAALAATQTAPIAPVSQQPYYPTAPQTGTTAGSLR
jgi:type IV secretion system protein VirB8